MPEVFLDADVLLDIITKRNPFYSSSNALVKLAEYNQISLSISECCIPSLIYVASVSYKIPNVNDLIVDLINTSDVLTAGKQAILSALNSNFKDKEDAIQYHIAIHNDLDYFITRNLIDYQDHVTSIPVYAPAEFIAST